MKRAASWCMEGLSFWACETLSDSVAWSDCRVASTVCRRHEGSSRLCKRRPRGSDRQCPSRDSQDYSCQQHSCMPVMPIHAAACAAILLPYHHRAKRAKEQCQPSVCRSIPCRALCDCGCQNLDWTPSAYSFEVRLLPYSQAQVAPYGKRASTNTGDHSAFAVSSLLHKHW